MASKSPIKRVLKRTKGPSKQELEWKPPFPSNAVQTPDHFGPHPRQTTEPQRETFLSSSSVSLPTSFVPLHSTFNYSTKYLPASPTISANLSSTNDEDHEDQLAQSLAPNTIQMIQLPPPNSEHSTAPWILASRERHMPKKPIDVELITRLADIRRQADGNRNSSSSPPRSLAMLGSCVSIASSAFSRSFSVASSCQVVEFPPEPVFTDAIPAGLMQKPKLLAVEQTSKAPALKNSYYPLQNSHTVIATRSLDTTHEVDNSSSTWSSPDSTPRQFPASTKSVLYYTPNPSCYRRPQMKTPTQTTPSSNIVQQPSGLTSASTVTLRTTNPLPRLPSNFSPPYMILPEHNPPSPLNTESLKTWWNQFTFVKSPKGDPFEGPYRGPFILSSYHKPTHPHAQHWTPLIIQSSGNLSRKSCNTPASKYPQQMPMAISTFGARFLLSSQNGPSLSSSALCLFPPHLGPQRPLSQGKWSVLVSCAVQRFLFSPFVPPTATEVPGIFSASGSNRRMRDLQAIFESPPHVRS